MNLRLPKEINEIIGISREEAMRTGCYDITPDHLILGMIRHKENAAYRLFERFRIDIPGLKESLNKGLLQPEIIPFEQSDKISFSDQVHDVLKEMIISARANKISSPDSVQMLLAIIRCNNSLAANLLIKQGMTAEAIIVSLDTAPKAEEPTAEEESITRKKAKASALESYSFDLTKAAEEEKLDPVVGRDKEIERLAQILCRRRKNNPILIGEPGVGKSAIVEGLAIRIAKKKISRALLNKRVVSLDIGSIVAGTKFRGQFEERIKSIITELKSKPDIILFIDELHTLVGAGGAIGSLDAANLLKPALSRGEIQCIGATTLDEFREVVEKDGALERRFQKVMVEPSTYEETLHILQSIKPYYEKHHRVRYSDEALKACISLSTRYITDRCLPDKAIDAMDEAGARAHVKNLSVPKKIIDLEKALYEIKQEKKDAILEEDFTRAGEIHTTERLVEKRYHTEMKKWSAKEATNTIGIGQDDIASVISLMTGIPVNRIALSESNKLLTMDQILKKKIIGQDEAVEKIVRAIRRNRAGLKDPNKPIGTFLFLGPTGVGKTQLAKELAEFMFDSKESLIRVDMSEYMEKFAVSRLIGAPPGYVGYKEGGQLSERVRRKPYSVVLLDEIEKAHPDIFNLLLQVLDEGRMTDSNGHHIDFRNTVLILTSNVGSRELKDFGGGIGYVNTAAADKEKKNKSIVEKALDKTFNPEFLNRLDEQIFFNELTQEDIEKIIDIELTDLYKRVEEAGYKLVLRKGAKRFLADVGYDPRFGARPLKRAIQHYVEDVVAEAILSNRFSDGDTITLTLNRAKNDIVIVG